MHLRRYFLFLFLLPAVCTACFAQMHETDSLHRLLEQHKPEDTLKVRLLNALAYNNLAQNLDSQQVYCLKALKIARRIHDPKGEAEALRLLGVRELLDQNRPAALNFFQKSFALFNSIGYDRGRCDVLVNMAHYYFLHGNKALSSTLLLRAKTLARHIHYQVGEAKVLHNEAEIAMAAKNFHLAEMDLDSAIRLSESLRLSRLLIPDYELLGDVCQGAGRYGQATLNYSKALAMSRQSGDIQNQILLLSKLGKGYENRRQYREARTAFENSIRLSHDYRSSNLLCEAYQHMASLDTSLKDYRAALIHYNLFMKVKDSLDRVDRTRQAAELHSRFESEQKEKQNKRLLDEAGRNTYIIRQQYIGLFLLIAMVIVLVYNAQKLKGLNTQKEHSLHELQLKNQEINHKNEIIEAQKQEQEKNNLVKDKLFSVISHDMRAPLTQLKGILNLMEMNALDSEEWQELVPELKKNVNHSTEQLDNLLLWSKNQMHGFDPRMASFTLFALVEKSRYVLETASQRKQIEVVNNIDPTMAVWADREMIQIVVRNLMSNAVKFTRQGGEVRVSATGSVNEGQCIVSVSDNGVGVKTEDRERIFEELDFTTKGTAMEKGTGLGLKLARDFVKMNGGRLWYEPNSSGGSIFKFSLPCQESKTPI